jgi:hypothetical protein
MDQQLDGQLPTVFHIAAIVAQHTVKLPGAKATRACVEEIVLLALTLLALERGQARVSTRRQRCSAGATSLPESAPLPCVSDTRQRPFYTRQMLCRV